MSDDDLKFVLVNKATPLWVIKRDARGNISYRPASCDDKKTPEDKANVG